MSNIYTAQEHLLEWFSEENFSWIESHQQTLSGMMALLLAGFPAHPHLLAEELPLDIKTESKIQKVRRLLDSPKLCPLQLLPTLVRVGVPLVPDKHWVLLSLDRTEYKQRGQWVQMLCVSLVLDGLSLPLNWSVDNAQGKTSFAQWKALMTPVISELQRQKELTEIPLILTGDREFISMPFAKWLKQEMTIDYVLRLTSSLYLHFSDGRSCQVSELEIQRGQTRQWSNVRVTDQHLWEANVCATWDCAFDEPVVLMHSLKDNDDPKASVLTGYAGRFSIEPTFSDLKSRGFDLEAIRINDSKRISTLMLVFVMTLLWYLIAGEALESDGDDVRLPPKAAPRAKRLRSWFALGRRAWRRVLMFFSPQKLQSFLNQFICGLLTGQPIPVIKV